MAVRRIKLKVPNPRSRTVRRGVHAGFSFFSLGERQIGHSGIRYCFSCRSSQLFSLNVRYRVFTVSGYGFNFRRRFLERCPVCGSRNRFTPLAPLHIPHLLRPTAPHSRRRHHCSRLSSLPTALSLLALCCVLLLSSTAHADIHRWIQDAAVFLTH